MPNRVLRVGKFAVIGGSNRRSATAFPHIRRTYAIAAAPARMCNAQWLISAWLEVRVLPGPPSRTARRISASAVTAAWCGRRCFSNKIKRLAEGDEKFVVLPGRVRKYKIQHAALLARLLSGEQPLGALGEFEEAHAFVEIAIVCHLMQRHLLHQFFPLRTPLFRHLDVEGTVDAAIELVDVHGVHPVL